ncbi:MAG TPA: hypothetical protein VHR66_16350, partial [Gemmataceae bacterium]|nr:hypothetical protein [Gemmataceae bacterium]
MRFASFAALLLVATAQAEPAPFVWIESELPAESVPATKPAETGHAEWLSGGKWLFVNVEPKDFAKQLPGGAASFKYPFTTAVDGKYEVWHRAGMEYVRSPFEWRIDDAPWVLIDARDPKFQTIDLMELATWNEVGWQKLGDQQLAKGDHKLEIRVPIPKDGKGQPTRLLFASDCFCLSAGPFHPYTKFKPGELNRDASDEQAAKQVFEFPAPARNAARSAVALEGLWEVCRYDEALPGPVAEPMTGLPDEPRWKAIAVPGDKNKIPELLFAHRLWYRCKVKVPAEYAGRSFVMTFPQNSL